MKDRIVYSLSPIDFAMGAAPWKHSIEKMGVIQG